jgi:hypothetical protein
MSVVETIDILTENNTTLKRAIERSNELADCCSKLGGTPQNQGQFIAFIEYMIDRNSHKIKELKKLMGD